MSAMQHAPRNRSHYRGTGTRLAVVGWPLLRLPAMVPANREMVNLVSVSPEPIPVDFFAQ